MNILYSTSIIIQVYVIILIKSNKEKIQNNEFWNEVLNNSSNVLKQKEVFDAVYWLNSDRYYWLSNDPIHFANGCNIVFIYFVLKIQNKLV
jgi:hypothetical protein